jgi:hypothetical protein
MAAARHFGARTEKAKLDPAGAAVRQRSPNRKAIRR